MDVVRVDFHVHSFASPDSLTRPEEVLAAMDRRGLDLVAITDHNTIEGALALKELAPHRVIVGEEVRTTQGELLAYFIHEAIPPDLPPEEAIARIRAQGGVVAVSHPLDRLRREAMGFRYVVRLIDKIDALEVYNARCLWGGDNQRAEKMARAHGLLALAGSDAHTAGEIGAAWVELPAFTDAQGLLAALREGQIRGRLLPPWVHFFSAYAKWVSRRAAKG